ncbi:hypothetical protein NDI49_07785 [Trichocoleus sp. ST-U3]
MEPISLTAGAIATLAFTKFFETSVEKLTEASLVKMEQLRKKIWEKLRGNPQAESALSKVEKGSKPDLERVAAYLDVVMNENPDYAKEVQTLAQEIINIGELQSENIWYVSGGEVNYSKDNKAPVIQGGSGHNITFN